MQHTEGRAWVRQCGGCIHRLPPEINWAHRMLSQSSASSLLHWSCAHWLKRVASVLSDVPLSVATLRTKSWALIRVLRSAQLRYVSLTWLLSLPLDRATNDRPAVMFQPSDSYTCSTIPLEHRLHFMYTAMLRMRLDWLWRFLAISVWWRAILAWPPTHLKFKCSLSQLVGRTCPRCHNIVGQPTGRARGVLAAYIRSLMKYRNIDRNFRDDIWRYI